jgi:glucosamine-6-phosphate deaminase
MVADLVSEYNRIFGMDSERSAKLAAEVRASIQDKHPGQPDSETILNIKGLQTKK